MFLKLPDGYEHRTPLEAIKGGTLVIKPRKRHLQKGPEGTVELDHAYWAKVFRPRHLRWQAWTDTGFSTRWMTTHGRWQPEETTVYAGNLYSPPVPGHLDLCPTVEPEVPFAPTQDQPNRGHVEALMELLEADGYPDVAEAVLVQQVTGMYAEEVVGLSPMPCSHYQFSDERKWWGTRMADLVWRDRYPGDLHKNGGVFITARYGDSKLGWRVFPVPETGPKNRLAARLTRRWNALGGLRCDPAAPLFPGLTMDRYHEAFGWRGQARDTIWARVKTKDGIGAHWFHYNAIGANHRFKARQQPASWNQPTDAKKSKSPYGVIDPQELEDRGAGFGIAKGIVYVFDTDWRGKAYEAGIGFAPKGTADTMVPPLQWANDGKSYRTYCGRQPVPVSNHIQAVRKRSLDWHLKTARQRPGPDAEWAPTDIKAPWIPQLPKWKDG